MTDTPIPQKRLSCLLNIFGILAFIIICRIVYLATAYNEQCSYLRQQSCLDEELIIPGCRGELRSSDGTLIAWSRRMFNIEWKIPDTYNQAKDQWSHFSQIPTIKDCLPSFETLENHLGQSVFFNQSFDYNDLDAWNAVLANYPLLIPHIIFKRELNHNLKSLTANDIGTTVIEPRNGIEIGLSGLEKLYDDKLRAGFRRCRYLSKRQRFIWDNLEVDGQNVILTTDDTQGEL